MKIEKDIVRPATYKQYISNYDNVKENIVYSPKNKRYTLSVGILNSQNEFQDITNTLFRWNDQSEVIDTQAENPSDLYKFNRGYFIAPERPINLDDTIKDSNLIKKRQILPVNTYAYKLVGPMYLKVHYNHITDFSYTILGEKDSSTGKYTIEIRGLLTYNCPDVDIPEEYNKQNIYPNYYTIEQLTNESVDETLNGFDFFEFKHSIALELQNVTKTIENYEYDELSNQYKVIIKTKITDLEPNRDGHFFDYVIAVGEKNLYLSNSEDQKVINYNQYLQNQEYDYHYIFPKILYL